MRISLCDRITNFFSGAPAGEPRHEIGAHFLNRLRSRRKERGDHGISFPRAGDSDLKPTVGVSRQSRAE